MISDQIRFWVEWRDISPKPDWALKAQLTGSNPWVLHTWEKKPGKATVKETKAVIMRAFSFYHAHLKIPPFLLQEWED